jgi:hypothetical protein
LLTTVGTDFEAAPAVAVFRELQQIAEQAEARQHLAQAAHHLAVATQGRFARPAKTDRLLSSTGQALEMAASAVVAAGIALVDGFDASRPRDQLMRNRPQHEWMTRLDIDRHEGRQTRLSARAQLPDRLCAELPGFLAEARIVANFHAIDEAEPHDLGI